MTDKQVLEKLEDPASYKSGSAMHELSKCRKLNKALREALGDALDWLKQEGFKATPEYERLEEVKKQSKA